MSLALRLQRILLSLLVVLLLAIPAIAQDTAATSPEKPPAEDVSKSAEASLEKVVQNPPTSTGSLAGGISS